MAIFLLQIASLLHASKVFITQNIVSKVSGKKMKNLPLETKKKKEKT